jgi:predicted dehydrogenase
MSIERPVGFAIVGCGRMGRHHGQFLARDARASIVAMFDPDRRAAEQLCSELAPHAVVCPSLDELWQQNDIHAVVLCTPTREHFEQAQTALQRGWHVLCEKPLATTAEEILTLIALGNEAGARGQQFSVGYQRRHWSTFRTLRREVQSGHFGPVRAISAHCVEQWQPTIADTWRDDPLQNPGGYIGDAGSHKLDILFYIANLPPRDVFARSWRRGSHVEIVSSIAAVFGDDVPVTMDFIGDAQHLGEDWHFHCAEADLILRQDGLWIARGNRINSLGADEPQSDPVPSFLDSICDNAPEIAPPQCAWPVFQLTQAILESSRSGIVVHLADASTTKD